MKFDRLTNLVLNEGKNKTSKFDNLVVHNANPTFRPEDILRDPNDPSKGTMLYLAVPEGKKKSLDPSDPQAIRRQLRRVNWVTKKLVKKYQNRQAGVTIEKLSQDIFAMLEYYQTNILKWSKVDKANTGYETRVIGNLLLPPTGRTPQGKAVFLVPGMDPSGASVKSVSSGGAAKQTRKVKVGGLPTAEELQQRFQQLVDRLDVLNDSDLRDIIKRSAELGDTIRDVLADERVEDHYPPEFVRDTIRGMLKADIIGKDGDGNLRTVPEEQSLPYRVRRSSNTVPSEIVSPEDTFEPKKEPVIDDSDEENIETEIPDDAPSWYPIAIKDAERKRDRKEARLKGPNKYKSIEDETEEINDWKQ